MVVTNDDIVEGLEYEVEVCAKGARGEGIGKLGDMVVLIKNAKTRVGNLYKVKITKVHRTFVCAELNDVRQQLVGNSILDL
jgi:predicted RNA-binding protein with TRAM domain